MNRTANLGCLAVGVAACLLIGIEALGHAASAAQGWLAAWLFWIGLSLGSLFLLFAHALTGRVENVQRSVGCVTHHRRQHERRFRRRAVVVAGMSGPRERRRLRTGI